MKIYQKIITRLLLYFFMQRAITAILTNCLKNNQQYW